MSTQNDRSWISYKQRQRFWNIVEGPYIVHLVLAFAVISTLVPIVWMFITSITPPAEVFQSQYYPTSLRWQSYQAVLFENGFWRALVNSAIITITTTAIVLMLAVPAGYAFSRFRFRFDNALFIGVIFSRLFPPIGIIIPYYEGIAALGLINTIPGIIIAQVYLWVPLMIYIIRNFFISIPEEIDESALVDGCTQFQAFRKIILPIARPGIAAASILTFLYSWREFLFSFIISNTLESKPISVAVYSFVGEVNIEWQQLAAACLLAILPTVLVVLFFQRYIVSGLTAGAVKGE